MVTYFQHIAVDIQLFCQYVCFGCFLGVAREKEFLIPYIRHGNYRAVVFILRIGEISEHRNLKFAYIEIHTLCCREHSALFGNHAFFRFVHRRHSLGGAVTVGYYQVIYGKAHRYFG